MVAAPRILNEPVRCRPGLEEHRRPERRENVSVDRGGLANDAARRARRLMSAIVAPSSENTLLHDLSTASGDRPRAPDRPEHAPKLGIVDMASEMPLGPADATAKTSGEVPPAAPSSRPSASSASRCCRRKAQPHVLPRSASVEEWRAAISRRGR
jgi:hypothetical protein